MSLIAGISTSLALYLIDIPYTLRAPSGFTSLQPFPLLTTAPFVGLFIYRELSVQKVIESLRFTALIAGLLVLLAPAQAFGHLSAYYGVPAAVQEIVTYLTNNRILVMMLIGAFYVLICFTACRVEVDCQDKEACPMFETVFPKRTLCDGSGGPPAVQDIGIRAGKVAAIGTPSHAGEHALAPIEAARKHDVDIAFDVIPHAWNNTGVISILPEWVREGGTGKTLERVKDPAGRQKVKDNPAPMLLIGKGWQWREIVLLNAVDNRALIGTDFVEIGKMRGVDLYDALMDMLIGEGEYDALRLGRALSAARCARPQGDAAGGSDSAHRSPVHRRRHARPDRRRVAALGSIAPPALTAMSTRSMGLPCRYP